MDEYIDLIVVTFYALAASALAIFARPTGAVALVIQAPVVLLLPGYAIMSAALPSSTLDRLERLTLSLGLSLAVTILGGLALNLVPAGLGTRSWSFLLTLAIIVGAAVALLRRVRLHSASGQKISLNPSALAATVAEGVTRCWKSLRLSAVSAPWRALGLGLALLIITGAIIFSNESAVHQSYPGFTQLWMLPSQAGDRQPSVQIGIVNDETGTTSYTLVLKSNQKTIRRISDIALARHGTWEETIQIAPGNKRTLIEGDLYVTGQATPVYRSVKVWIRPASDGT
jgi:uncharacterized membrane protein